jgi:hypothetical protein
VRIIQYGADNSFATDHPSTELRFGNGGVDDAEDAEVILHEYGHAIHFSQNFSFDGEGGAISDGFGDYCARREHGRRRAVALRQERGERRHGGVPGSRHPLIGGEGGGGEVRPPHPPHQL